jgi:hypothetical protein
MRDEYEEEGMEENAEIDGSKSEKTKKHASEPTPLCPQKERK